MNRSEMRKCCITSLNVLHKSSCPNYVDVEPPRITPDEEWRPAYLHKYKVSNLGRAVYYRRPTVILNSHLTSNGYHRVGGAMVDGVKRMMPLHVAVCTAFHGPRPFPDAVVRHLNGDKNDNRAVNLAWGTHSENQKDRVRHGRNELANRTTCNNGHPFDSLHTANGKTTRRCKTCHRDGERRRRQAKLAQR